MDKEEGGEGAILNSKGELSRSYIPRLQVVEEEPQEDPDIREQTTKAMRAQDGDWEQTKKRELGRNAILGPKTSPLKRVNEQNEGAIVGNKRKRRRKLKHELIGVGWGELPKNQGAEEGGEQAPITPDPQAREQYLEAEEQLPPAPQGEQCSPVRQAGSQVTREQPRRQARISEFLSPTPRVWQSSARPTVDQEASYTRDLPATRQSSWRSPCKAAGGVEPVIRDRDKWFEGRTDMTERSDCVAYR